MRSPPKVRAVGAKPVETVWVWPDAGSSDTTARAAMRMASSMKASLLPLWALGLWPTQLFGWTNGELLIWMDADRGRALTAIAQKFEDDFGLKATIETPENLTASFPLAAQAALQEAEAAMRHP